jgi:hypothetical protein
VIYIIIFPAYAKEPGTKILFIGNSFTSVNNIPDVFKKLDISPVRTIDLIKTLTRF